MTCSVAGDRYSWYAANKAKQFQWQHPWWHPQVIEKAPNVSGQTLRKVYEESLLAIREDARILAGLGLRGVIEAVRNDLPISGSSLV
jgi:hypothetical protein